MIFNRCYATSEWTQPSVPSMATGLYTTITILFTTALHTGTRRTSKLFRKFLMTTDILRRVFPEARERPPI